MYTEYLVKENKAGKEDKGILEEKRAIKEKKYFWFVWAIEIK